MRELRDHHTHDDTQELANDGDRNGDGQCRFRGGTGKNRKRSGDDTSELHVWCITNGLTVAGNLLSALGFAMLLSSMLSKKMFPYFLLGFLIVAYSGLSLIGVTMFAAILAFILDKVLYGKGANA